MAEKIEWYGTIPNDCDWMSFANQTDLGYEYDTTFHKITATTDDNQFKPYDDIKFVVDYNTSSASRTAKVKFEQKEGAIDYCYISQNGTEFEQIWKHYSKSNDAIVKGTSNKTANEFEVAVGNCNSTRKGMLFSVGNGTLKNRSNAFEVDSEKAKANRIETAVLSATSISADTLVLKDNSLADIDVSYEPTITKSTPNNYVIGKLMVKGKESTIYGIDTKSDVETGGTTPTAETYIHVAYSNSSTDWAKESEINDPSSAKYNKMDWKYIGFHSSYSKNDYALSYDDYNWTKFGNQSYKLVPLKEDITATQSSVDGNIVRKINASLSYRLVRITEGGYVEELFDDEKRVNVYLGNNGNETTTLANYFVGKASSDKRYWTVLGSTSYDNSLQYFIVTCERENKTIDQRIVYVTLSTNTIFEVTDEYFRIAQQASSDVKNLSANSVTHTNFESFYDRYASGVTDSFNSFRTEFDTYSGTVKSAIAENNELIRTSSANVLTISERLKNLSVGSVNLIYNSSFDKDDNDNVSYWGTCGNPTNVTVSKEDDGWDWVTIRSKDDGAFWQSAQRRYEGAQSCNDLKPDTYYTCSFYAYGDSESEKHDVLIHFVDKNKMNNNLGQVRASNEIGNLIEYKSWEVEDKKLCIPITKTKTRYWFTFKTPKNNDIGFFNIMFGFWGAKEEKEVHFSKPQLEEGNMCTDWKESGVYYDKEISSKIEQRASSITTSVDDKLNKLSSKIEQTASSIKTSVNDEMNKLSSKIEQTASSVKLSVENEINGKLNQTGIDIQNGSINLNADNTNIIGNLSLHANKGNGLVVYDESGNTRVSLQPREIGRMSDNNMSTYDYLFKMTYFDVNNDTLFNKAIPRYNVKGAVANDKIQITEAYIDINYIKGHTNDWTQPPQSIRYEYRIYSDSAVVDTESGTATLETTANSHIYSIKNLDYTVKNDGDYSVEVYVEATIPKGTTQVELSLNGYIIKAVPSLTFIGQDGYYSTQGIYKKIWFGNDGFELIWADDKAAANGQYDGIKLDDNGLQRLASFSTVDNGTIIKKYAPISSFRRIKMLTKADFLDAYSYTLKRAIKAYTVKPTDETVIITDCLSSYFIILPNNVVDGRLVELKNVTDQNPSILLEKGYEGAVQPYLMDFRRGNDHIRDMGNRVWQLKACTLDNIIGDGEMRGYTQWMVWND